MKNILALVLSLFFSNLIYSNAYARDALVFGTLYFYPPFVYSHNATPYAGFDIDLATAICSKLNVQCKFIALPLRDIFEDLQTGTLDAAISAIVITEDRKKIFNFSRPYYQNSASYLVLVNSEIAHNPADIVGKTVGVTDANIFRVYLAKKYGDKITIRNYRHEEDLINDVMAGKIDTALLDTEFANYWVARSKGALTTAGAPFKDPTFEAGYGIVISKKEPALVGAINNALAALMHDGTYQALTKKYFSSN